MEMLVFKNREKPDYLEKNLSVQRREPTTNSAHIRLNLVHRVFWLFGQRETPARTSHNKNDREQVMIFRVM